MVVWKVKQLVFSLTISFFSVIALTGCGGSNSGDSTVPFSALTSPDGTGTAARFQGPLSITNDGTNIYVADTGNNIIRKIVMKTGTVTTLAGSVGTKGSTDGTGTAARFLSPSSIATDGTNLYVADTGNNTIRKIVLATGVVTTLAGTAGSSGSKDGTGAAAQFLSPYGIATDGANLYVADSGNNTIRQIVLASGVVTTLAGTAGSNGSSDGTTTAKFYHPFGMAYDSTNLYVADRDNHTIRKVDLVTGNVTTLAGEAGKSGSTDATGLAAHFNSPTNLASDGTNLYVADSGNNTIRTVSIAAGVVKSTVSIAASSGEVMTLAGTAGASGSVDGTGAAARFNSPYGISTDGTNLYVADKSNNTIRKIVIATGTVTTLAGSAP